MGSTTKNLIIKRDPADQEGQDLAFLVDSGATYSLVPASILSALGIRAHGEVQVELANGKRLVRRLGGAYFEYLGEGGFSPVLFGEEGDEPLLGVVTLEALRLVLNPYRRELYPQKVVRL